MCETYVVQGLCPPAKKKAQSEFLPRVASGGGGCMGGDSRGHIPESFFHEERGHFFGCALRAPLSC